MSSERPNWALLIIVPESSDRVETKRLYFTESSFGNSFRRLVCLNKKWNCRECILKENKYPKDRFTKNRVVSKIYSKNYIIIPAYKYFFIYIKIFIFHKPGWSAGGGHGNNTTVQQVLQPLFEQHGIKLAISGHNHYYAHAVVNGVNYITTGGGGAPLYNPNPIYDSIVLVKKSYHYCKITINGDTLTFKAIKDDGTTIETFKIDKTNTNINEQTAKQDIKVFSSKKTIKIRNTQNTNGIIAVYDNYGRKIYEKKITGISLSIPVKTSGIYFVRLTNGNKIVAVKKLFIK